MLGTTELMEIVFPTDSKWTRSVNRRRSFWSSSSTVALFEYNVLNGRWGHKAGSNIRRRIENAHIHSVDGDDEY